jgi:hypothetical protein
MKKYIWTIHMVDGTKRERPAMEYMPTICAGTGDLYNDADLDEPTIPRDEWAKVERNWDASRRDSGGWAKVTKNPTLQRRLKKEATQ